MRREAGGADPLDAVCLLAGTYTSGRTIATRITRSRCAIALELAQTFAAERSAHGLELLRLEAGQRGELVEVRGGVGVSEAALEVDPRRERVERAALLDRREPCGFLP